MPFGSTPCPPEELPLHGVPFVVTEHGGWLAYRRSIEAT